MQKYLSLFRLSAIQSFKNYKTLIGLSIFLMTCLLIFAHIWEIASARPGMLPLNPTQLLWYIALNEWVIISLPDVQDDIEQDLRSGRLAYLLPRPISYLGSVFCEGLGVLCVNLLVLGIVAFSFTWWRIGELPFNLAAMPVIIALGLLAGCVGMVFQIIIGLSAFWIQQVSPFFWVWEKMLFTLGGLILPLAVYPEWLQKIALLTPFPGILGERSALAIHYTLYDVLQVASALAVWGLIGTAFAFALYLRGLKIVNVEGG